MIVPVEKHFNQIEAQRNALLNEISRLSHAQQNFKPSRESWSILQVLNHLVYSETNTVKYMNKKMLGIAAAEKSGIYAKVRMFVLNAFLRSPLKFKAPKAALPVQEEVYVFDNMKKQWDDVRFQFGKIIDQLGNADADKLIFKHPISGKFNIYQTMSFLEEHIEHHKKQIGRIKSSPLFPS